MSVETRSVLSHEKERRGAGILVWMPGVLLAILGAPAALAAPDASDIWETLASGQRKQAEELKLFSDSDRQEYFLSLVEIFRHPSRFIVSETPEDHEVRAVILALKESGRYATDSGGKLFPIARKFYEEVASRDGEDREFPLQAALAESLANTGTPEGVELIGSLLRPGNVANAYLLRQLEKARESAVSDGTERLARRKDWMKAYGATLPRVERLLQDPGSDGRTRELARKYLVRQVAWTDAIEKGRTFASLETRNASFSDEGRQEREPAHGAASDLSGWMWILLGLAPLSVIGLFGVMNRSEARET